MRNNFYVQFYQIINYTEMRNGEIKCRKRTWQVCPKTLKLRPNERC